MRPESLGRVLGVGLRVAGRVAAQRIMTPQAAPPPSQPAAPGQRPNIAGTVQNAARARSNLGRGIAGFLKPFRRVGGILWLEITGVFFLLPVVVFLPTLWRTRLSYLDGPDHRTFVASAVVVVVFAYLGVTSFLRARRK